MRSIRRLLDVGSTICALLFTVLLFGCGGSGGGDGGDNVDKFSRVGVVDSTTAPRIVSGIGNIITGTNAAVNPVSQQLASGIYCPKTLIHHGVDAVCSSGQGFRSLSGTAEGSKVVLGSESDEVACSDGGSTAITAEWDGPQNPQDCSEARNPSIEFEFKQCKEDTETLNGRMEMSWRGDLCTETPNAFEVAFDNLWYQNSAEDLNLTMNFTMDFSGVQYDAYDYIVAMTMWVDGSINGDFEGSTMDASFDDWTMVCEGIEYNEYDEIVQMSVTVDGGLSGTIDGDSVDERCRNLDLTWHESVQNSAPGILYTINGDYAGRCLEGGVTIETIEPVFWPEESLCPESGELHMYGDGNATVVFNSDGSVSITADGEVVDYPSCESLPPC